MERRLNEEPLSPKSLKSKNPLKQFQVWFEEAKTSGIKDPNVVCLATCSKNCNPSCRMMSVTSFDERGYLFFTHKRSKKGCDLEANPKASICFYWEPMHRQVTITGSIKTASEEETRKYFDQMPFECRVNYFISLQGKVIESKQQLVDLREQYRKKFQNEQIPVPESWRGYTLVPECYEFWQRGPYDFDDIVRFKRPDTASTTFGEEDWIVEELAP